MKHLNSLLFLRGGGHCLRISGVATIGLIGWAMAVRNTFEVIEDVIEPLPLTKKTRAQCLKMAMSYIPPRGSHVDCLILPIRHSVIVDFDGECHEKKLFRLCPIFVIVISFNVDVCHCHRVTTASSAFCCYM